MSPTASDLVRSLLRPSENLNAILSVHPADVDALSSNASPDHTDPSRRHLVAIVTHRSSPQDTEVGCLLVSNAFPTNGLIKVVDALPITEHLTLAVAQSGPVDAHIDESDPGVDTEAWSAWRLTIRREEQDTRPLTYGVRMRNTQKLQNFTAECRRLKEIASTAHPTSADFSWVGAYFLDASSYRPDLRLRNKSLFTRLSTSAAGSPGDDALDISIVRRDWIEQTAAKEASTGNVKRLKIRIGTFNVNGKTPSQDLYPWLRSSEHDRQVQPGWISPLKLSPFEVHSDPLPQDPPENNSLAGAQDSHPSSFGDPDVLVLGFQELDLSTEALLYATSTLKEDEWVAAIFAGLGEKRALYEKLTARQLVGMLLIVIVKRALSHCFTDVRSCDAGSGLMGFMGNKGATAVRLKFTPTLSSDPPMITYRSTVLTFVNAHLAASDEMVERRNSDFQELSSRLVFSPYSSNGSHSSASFSEDTYKIYQSDVLFWMGGEVSLQRAQEGLLVDLDLNYRLDLPGEDIRDLLFSHASGIDSIQTLLLHDQLGAAIRSNKAFSGFMEHTITHLPTYRLSPGLSKDRLGYDINRKPAWTDRVLYMAPPDVMVAQVAYKSHPEITMSDHQPVSADFVISLALIDQLRHENAVSALHRELAGFEDSEHRPRIKIQPTSIELGIVKYKQAIHREVVLRNDGEVPCVFRLVGTGADPGSISPPWLQIAPAAGLLRPSETTTISLSAYVDNDLAAKLNLGSPTFGCTLVLHTALGRDDFIAVSGDFQYTCFANTLERLTRLASPIRKLESPEDLIPVEQAINAPREIMRLINWMMAHVSATDTLFEHPAQERQCYIIRECLDTGDEFPQEDPGDGDHPTLVAAFASTLVALFDSLIEPAVPARLHARCLQSRDRDEAFEVLDAFPHESINVWISLMACLHYIARQSGSKEDPNASSSTKAQKLASVFAPVLLRDDPTGVYPRASHAGKRDFLLHFIH